MVTSYSRINFLTINDAHLFADVLIKNNIMDFRCSDAHLSFWWNRSNCQLVVRNIDTQEIMTFEDIETGDDLVRPILLAWMYTGWDKRD